MKNLKKVVKPLFNNMVNIRYAKKHYEYSPNSLTKPDLSITTKELIIRHERGLPIGLTKTPYYAEEEIVEIDRMDLAEREEYILNLESELKERQEILDDKRKRAKTKADAEAWEARKKAWAEESRKPAAALKGIPKKDEE